MDLLGGGAGIGLLSGAGVPAAGLGSNGNLYVDTTNGDVYSKSGGAWSLVTGGTGTNNQSGVGSPVGVAVPDYVGQYYAQLGPPVAVWVSTGLTNADWIEVAGNLT